MLGARCISKKMSAKLGPQIRRRLAAFDFDCTVVNQNTDTVIRDMLPTDKFPCETIIAQQGWMEYMSEVFRRLHQLCYPPQQLREQIRCIPEVPGFVRLLKRLQQCDGNKYDLIIISDSNSVFIKDWLDAHGLADCFLDVFTNPAHFDADGMLHVRPYHHQTECKLSAANLCKAKVLDHFMMERNLRDNTYYERIIYVGDGSNDLCPALKLRPGDIVCARRDFALDKKIAKRRPQMELRADVVLWKSGFELLELLTQYEPGLAENAKEDDCKATE